MSKPFNLTEALAGKPVVQATRHIRAHNLTVVGTKLAYTLEGDDDYIYQCLRDGKNLAGQVILEMATTEKSAWVNVYPAPPNTPKTTACVIGGYDTEERANEQAMSERIGKAIKITWTE